MESKDVVGVWKELCESHKVYFEVFGRATHCANLQSSKRNTCQGLRVPGDGAVLYPELSTDPDEIGAWCQDFWEALPDSKEIHKPAFYLVCDIAEWWCFGE